MASQLDILNARNFAIAIKNYWAYAASGNIANGAEARSRLATAQSAMDHLAWHAVTDDDYKAVIREFALVEGALTLERGGITDDFCAGTKPLAPDFELDLDLDDDQKPPRVILLQAMHSAIKGEFFRNPDTRGVVPWLNSIDGGAAAFASTIGHDHLPIVWFQVFGILLSTALPARWVLTPPPLFGAEPAPSQLIVETQRFVNGLSTMTLKYPESRGAARGNFPMPQELRAALNQAATQAYGRLDQARADAARALSQLPQSAGGGGIQIPADLMVSAPKRPWYRDGKIIAGALAGLVGGAVYANKSARR
jgi:hypothetical protein